MKNKKKATFIVLLCMLIALVTITLMFVNYLSMPITHEPVIISEHGPKKSIYYIANNLSYKEEYDQAFNIKKMFEENKNIEFFILDSVGHTDKQLGNIIHAKNSNPSLIIADIINSEKITSAIANTHIPVITLNAQEQVAEKINICFSDSDSGKLVSQSLFASLYPDSQICIIAKSAGSSLYQNTVNQIEKTFSKISRGKISSSYFTHGFDAKDLNSTMPNMLNSDAIAVLDANVLSSVIDYATANSYLGIIITVSSDIDNITRIFDSSLDCIILKDPEVFANEVYNFSLEILQNNYVGKNNICYQNLLNIYNTSEFLETKSKRG